MTLSKKDTEHNKIAIFLSIFNAECRDLLIVMLNVIKLNVVAPRDSLAVAGNVISVRTEPKSCLGRVFNFKLACFGSQD
jgi:hypothetical protein